MARLEAAMIKLGLIIAAAWCTAAVIGGFIIGHWLSGRDL